MATFGEIIKVFDAFGEDLTQDLLKSFEAKGHASPGESGKQSSLAPNFDVRFTTDNQILFTLKMNEYYKFIDKGTKAARKRSSITDRQKKIKNLISWAARRNINALAWYKKKLKDPSKSKMTYDKAAKSLANAISHNVAKKGIIERFSYGGSHFYSDVISDGRLNVLKDALEKALGKEVLIQLSE